MLVDLAADRDLDPLGRPRGLPAAREPEELAQDRDQQDQDDQPQQTELGRFRDREGKPGRDCLGQWPGQHDVVDHGLGGGRRDQLQDRRQREPHKRQRERRAMAHEEPVKLAVQPGQRAMLGRREARAGLPAALSRRPGTGSDTLGIGIGWQSVDGMMTRGTLG